MKNLFWIMIVAFGLSGCATLKEGADATGNAIGDAYNWVVGDDEKKDDSSK